MATKGMIRSGGSVTVEAPQAAKLAKTAPPNASFGPRTRRRLSSFAVGRAVLSWEFLRGPDTFDVMSIAFKLQTLLSDNFLYDSLVIMKRRSSHKRQRKLAGTWLKGLRARAGLTQMELAERLGFKYYSFVSQVENGFGRMPTEKIEAWAQTLGVEPTQFTKTLISFYEPELHRLLCKAEPGGS